MRNYRQLLYGIGITILFILCRATEMNAQCSPTDRVQNTRTGTWYNTIQSAVTAAITGDELRICAGSFQETIDISKRLIIKGAQAGVSAVDRQAEETIIAYQTLRLNNGSTGTVIDGISFHFNSTSISLAGFNLGNVRIINNRFFHNTNSITTGGSPLPNLTIDNNLFDGGNNANQNAIQLQASDLQGCQITNNMFTQVNGTCITLVGNRTMKPNLTRIPQINNNTFFANLILANLGQALDGAELNNNIFDRSVGGISGGPRNSIISNNQFSRIERWALYFSGDGSTDPTRGAQGNLVRCNLFYQTGDYISGYAGGIYLDRTQVAGTLPTNTITENNFIETRRNGSFAIQYTGTETIHAENNWWGDASGPTINSNPGGTGEPILNPSGSLVYSPFLTAGSSCVPGGNPTIYYQDNDHDGYGNTVTRLAFQAPAGFVDRGGDCNDLNNTIYPGAPELCDGLDNDCNGSIEEKPSISFDINGHHIQTDANGQIDPSETYTLSLCNGQSFYRLNLVHSSQQNRYQIRTSTVSGSGAIINYTLGDMDLNAMAYSGINSMISQIGLVNPSQASKTIYTTTPYFDTNNNGVLDEGDCKSDPFFLIFDVRPNFVVLTQEGAEFQKNKITGNVGVWGAGKAAKFRNATELRGSVQAPVIQFDEFSWYYGITSFTPATIALPAFIYNTNSTETRDITIPDNAQGLIEIQGNSFRKITIGKFTNVKFVSTGDIFIKEFVTKDNGIDQTFIDFSGPTRLIIRKKLDFGKKTFLNDGNAQSVSIYVQDEDVKIGASSRVYADIDLRFKNLIVEDTPDEWYPTEMSGHFIAKKLDAKKNVNWFLPCVEENLTPLRGVEQQVQTLVQTPLKVKVFPNPSSTEFRLSIKGDEYELIRLRIFDVNGKLIYNNQHPANNEIRIGSVFRAGIYFAEILQGGNRETIKLIKAR